MWVSPRFDVIYHLIGDLRVELGDRMPPVEVEDVVGRLLVLLLGKQPPLVLRATVIQQFQITEKKEKVAVAGCRVRVGSNQIVLIKNTFRWGWEDFPEMAPIGCQGRG